jgi:hypothetical protein
MHLACALLLHERRCVGQMAAAASPVSSLLQAVPCQCAVHAVLPPCCAAAAVVMLCMLCFQGRSPGRRDSRSGVSDKAHSHSPARRPEYSVRVPLHPFSTAVRDYSDIARRYPHMYINPDFVKVVFRWPEVSKD